MLFHEYIIYIISKDNGHTMMLPARERTLFLCAIARCGNWCARCVSAFESQLGNSGIPHPKNHLGMSENGVYPQWNSHLVGIMISKTIGFRGVPYFQTHPFDHFESHFESRAIHEQQIYQRRPHQTLMSTALHSHSTSQHVVAQTSTNCILLQYFFNSPLCLYWEICSRSGGSHISLEARNSQIYTRPIVDWDILGNMRV